MRVILGAHAQAPANALFAHGAVDFLELGYTFTAIVALGADAAVVLFTAIIAVLFRLLLFGAVIAVAAVAGEVSVGAARAAADAVGLLVAVVVAIRGATAAVATAVGVPVVVAAARTFHSVLIGGVDMKLHARQQREHHHDTQQPRQEPLSTRRTSRGRSVHFFAISSFHLSSSSFSGSCGTTKKINFPAAGMGDGLAVGMPVSQLISTIAFRKMI